MPCLLYCSVILGLSSNLGSKIAFALVFIVVGSGDCFVVDAAVVIVVAVIVVVVVVVRKCLTTQSWQPGIFSSHP